MAEQAPAQPTPNAAPSTQKAGEGPQLQVNLASSGAINAIRDHVMRNWTFTPGSDLRGLQVSVQLSLDDAGNITQLYVTQSSGQAFFDNSLLRAIRKSIPLPIPAAEKAAFRDIELTFQPLPQ